MSLNRTESYLHNTVSEFWITAHRLLISLFGAGPTGHPSIPLAH